MKRFPNKYFFICLLFSTVIKADPPQWNVNGAGYSMSANMTAILLIDGVESANPENLVGVFIGDTCRGFASPIEINNSWFYFITFYSNSNQEEMRLKAYSAADDKIYDVDETIVFESNKTFGDVDNPFILNVYIQFDFPPKLYGIPDQKIELGDSFTQFDLDDYLYQQDDDKVIYLHDGSGFINVSIDENNVATALPIPGRVGEEQIIFTAVEQTVNGLSNSDTVIFTVLKKDHPPELSGIPNQTIGIFGNFEPIDLNKYLSEIDGDSTGWEIKFTTPAGNETKPEWKVNGSNYQYSMTITAEVIANGRKALAGNHLLGAFAVGTNGELEIRGVAFPVNSVGTYEYFLTVYSNTENEKIVFKFFDAEFKRIFNVKENFSFYTNDAVGSPEHPAKLHAGNIGVEIIDGTAKFEIIDTSWSGDEYIEFFCTDLNTLKKYSDSTNVKFSVIPDYQPKVMKIPDQKIEIGEKFAEFDLDDYLLKLDDDRIAWKIEGERNLIANIGAGNVVVVSAIDNSWTGSETLTFIAEDKTAFKLRGTNSAEFTITPKDYRPALNPVPSQTIGIGGKFEPIVLNNYLTLRDSDEIGWSYKFQRAAQPSPRPEWQFDKTGFQYLMNITAIVRSNGELKADGRHFIGAFVQSGDNLECRGIAEPVQSVGGYQYFLTVYANAENEKIYLKFYDADFEKTVPIDETFDFKNSAVFGSPELPRKLNAGNILIDIVDGKAEFKLVNPNWTGKENVVFYANDLGTLKNYGDSSLVSFTVLEDHKPQLFNIPDQIIEQYENFAPFNLNNYLTELDGEQIKWSYSAAQNLSVQILSSGNVTVSKKAYEWVGKENVVFYATDNTANKLSDSDTVTFTVRTPDRPPEISAIPDQIIYFDEFEKKLNLLDYLIEKDGNDIRWNVKFAPPDNPVRKPDWKVNATDYEYSMNITAEAEFNNESPNDTDILIAAFNNEECRGVAKPSKVGDNWRYFLTIYSNTAENDEIYIKYYSFELREILPVKQKQIFKSNLTLGGPLAPYKFDVGLFDAKIEKNELIISLIDSTWIGEDDILVIVKDIGTTNQFTDTASVKIVRDAATDIKIDIDKKIPSDHKLLQNYPNPFNPMTTIKYSIPSLVNRQSSLVQLFIYGALGEIVATPVNEQKSPGNYSVKFNGSDLSSGIYFYALIVNGNMKEVKRMVLLK